MSEFANRKTLNSRLTQLSLACSASTAPETLTNLAILAKDDEEICQAIARNIRTPIATLKSLMCWRATGDDEDYPRSVKVTREVINNPNIPVSYLEQIIDGYANTCWYAVMVEFCKSPKLSLTMIEKIAKTYHANLLIDIARVQDLPEILDNIAHNCRDESVVIKIAKNPKIYSRTVEYLAFSNSFKIRNLLIKHPNVTKKALDIILFMQKKPGVPIELIEEIADNAPHFSILRLITEYPSTSSETLKKIANTVYKDKLLYKREALLDMQMVDNLISHPNTSSAVLNQILSKLNTITFINGKKPIKRINRVRKRLSGEHYVVPSKMIFSSSENNLLKDRYSRENLYESELEDIIPF